jgi:Ca2+-binding RTX toxin-like protein
MINYWCLSIVMALGVIGIGGTVIFVVMYEASAADIQCKSNKPCTGTSKDDRLSGTSGQNFMWGLGGKDILRGLAADDSAYGGENSDILYGGRGNDRLVGGGSADKVCGNSGADSLLGRGGNDFIYGDSATTGLPRCTAASPGADKIWGGNGKDLVYGGPNGPQAQTIESIFGGSGNDRILGEDGNDDLFGQAGADEISGGPGEDYLFAGQTDVSTNTTVIPGQPGDKLRGGPGKDRFDCGGMPDTIIQDFEQIDSKINCPLSSNTPPGTLNVINCSSSSNTTCLGTDQDDNMTGDSGVNDIEGKGGNDIIYGYKGGDIITGSGGDDKIYHNSDLGSQSTAADGSKDTIDCGPGTDEVWINEQSDGDVTIANTCETVHQ